jgi:hypothetical protein
MENPCQLQLQQHYNELSNLCTQRRFEDKQQLYNELSLLCGQLREQDKAELMNQIAQIREQDKLALMTDFAKVREQDKAALLNEIAEARIQSDEDCVILLASKMSSDSESQFLQMINANENMKKNTDLNKNKDYNQFTRDKAVFYHRNNQHIFNEAVPKEKKKPSKKLGFQPDENLKTEHIIEPMNKPPSIKKKFPKTKTARTPWLQLVPKPIQQNQQNQQGGWKRNGKTKRKKTMKKR